MPGACLEVAGEVLSGAAGVELNPLTNAGGILLKPLTSVHSSTPFSLLLCNAIYFFFKVEN